MNSCLVFSPLCHISLTTVIPYQLTVSNNPANHFSAAECSVMQTFRNTKLICDSFLYHFKNTPIV